MKSVLTISLFSLLALTTVTHAQTQDVPLADRLQGWKTIRISFILEGGDFYFPPRFILLERLDSNRVRISIDEESARSESGLRAHPVITAETAQKLIERALEFCAIAKKETGYRARIEALPPAEREAELKRHYFGFDATYIGFHVQKPYSFYEFKDDFDESNQTMSDFAEFVMHPKIDLKNSKP